MNQSLLIIETLVFLNVNEKRELIVTCLKCLYQIVYVLCKIRGIQTISKFFSSEVYVFEPVISFLLSLNPEESENCDMIYVLILWTSILGLIPFDVETIDTKGIIINMLPLYFKKTLNSSGNIREITAYALSKFITRPDIIKKGLLKDLLEFFVEYLQNEQKNKNIFMDIGILSALYEIFKNGIPSDLTSYIDYIVQNVISYPFPEYMLTGGIIRRYFSKLTQRIGLVILKPKFQKWRYAIHLKNLLQNKKLDSSEAAQDSSLTGFNQESEEIDYDLNIEILEILIDKTLTALTDREYIVRWSTAKGVGRLCERLTKNMVDQILQNIFDLFEDEENEFSWQGGILAIAELCKRGMILPDKLEKVMCYLEKALIFEVNKGTFCSGSNVRDSACYLAWALARAYSKHVLQGLINRLAQRLILVMLFDKEVNCRRAASAAFQEHVGRQGYFPNGIEIITEADYFTLGNRSNCYLNISTFVSQYPGYSHAIFDYLSENRLVHVEENIRTLSAETLGLLVCFDADYFINKIIPNIIQMCFSSNIFTRQGALLGLGYILAGLRGKWDFEQKSKRIRIKMLEGMSALETKVLEDSDYRKAFEENYNNIKYLNNIQKINSQDIILNKILGIPVLLEQKKLYRGKGGEIMRNAVNNFIRLICEADLLLDEKVIFEYLQFLLDNLKHPNLEIQKDAAHALKLLLEKFGLILNNNSLNLSKEILEKINLEYNIKIQEIIKNSITDESIYIKRGFSMSFGCFPDYLIIANLEEILKNLIQNCKYFIPKLADNPVNSQAFGTSAIPISKEDSNESAATGNSNTSNDFETRRISIEALGELAVKISGYDTAAFFKSIEKILEYIFESLKDYEIDRKLGDVGGKVRESAIRSLTSIMLNLLDKLFFDKCYLDLFANNIVKYLSGLLKQLGEKLNKIRYTAGESLQSFFYNMSLKETSADSVLQNKNNINNNFNYSEFLKSCIPNLQELKNIFLEDIKFNELNQIYNIEWLEPAYSFKKIVSLLLTDAYSYSLFEGMIISIGGLTEDVQRFSLNAIDKLLELN